MYNYKHAGVMKAVELTTEQVANKLFCLKQSVIEGNRTRTEFEHYWSAFYYAFGRDFMYEAIDKMNQRFENNDEDELKKIKSTLDKLLTLQLND